MRRKILHALVLVAMLVVFAAIFVIYFLMPRQLNNTFNYADIASVTLSYSLTVAPINFDGSPPPAILPHYEAFYTIEFAQNSPEFVAFFNIISQHSYYRPFSTLWENELYTNRQSLDIDSLTYGISELWRIERIYLNFISADLSESMLILQQSDERNISINGRIYTINNVEFLFSQLSNIIKNP